MCIEPDEPVVLKGFKLYHVMTIIKEDYKDEKVQVELESKVEFSDIHIFPYSRRSGTVAAKMPNQIRNSVKHERAKQLIVKADELEQAFLSRFIGDIQGVLFETCEDGFAVGYTGNYNSDGKFIVICTDKG